MAVFGVTLCMLRPAWLANELLCRLVSSLFCGQDSNTESSSDKLSSWTILIDAGLYSIKLLLLYCYVYCFVLFDLVFVWFWTIFDLVFFTFVLSCLVLYNFRFCVWYADHGKYFVFLQV